MSTNLKETSPLELYGHNLTALAQQGKFTPLSGYEAVIDRAFEILLRKTKCLPILIDNTPTRPDIIVMEVARRIVTGEVPESLAGKQLIALDYEALFANTEAREALYGAISSNSYCVTPARRSLHSVRQPLSSSRRFQGWS